MIIGLRYVTGSAFANSVYLADCHGPKVLQYKPIENEYEFVNLLLKGESVRVLFSNDNFLFILPQADLDEEAYQIDKKGEITIRELDFYQGDNIRSGHAEDSEGNIYFVFVEGNVLKFDPNSFKLSVLYNLH